MTLQRRHVLVGLGALAALMTSGCDRPPPKFQNTDVTGVDFAKGFSLVDHTGARRTLADYRGKVVTVFFGFTHCPDVCPVTLAEMTQVMAKLGKDANRVQVLFITVDPERDTPQVLSQYVPAFDKRFVGLTGSPQEIAAVAKDFKVFYQKVPGKSPNEYSVDHFAGTYVFDTQGRIRLFVKYGQKADVMASDIEQLLKT